MTELTEQQVMERFYAKCREVHGKAKIARAAGVTHSPVQEVQDGRMRITTRICAAIGVRAVIGKGRYAQRKFYEAG